jgi:hypothetical protein
MGQGKRVPETVVLDAIWSWTGLVTEAAASIGMPRSHYYERLREAGVTKEAQDILRSTGRLVLYTASGEREYAPSPGSQRYVQPKNYVPQRDEAPVTKFSDMTAAAPRRAVIDLAEAGFDTDKDALLDALAESEQFRAFVVELLRALEEKQKGGAR